MEIIVNKNNKIMETKKLEETIVNIENKLEALQGDLGNIASLYSAVLYTLERVEEKLADPKYKLTFPDMDKFLKENKE